MKRWTPAYLVVLAGAIFALTTSKLDKISFFHHYFRVIAEVELRNSQALEKAVPYVAQESPAAFAANEGLSTAFGTAFAAVSVVLPAASTGLPPSPAYAARPQMAAFWNACPSRGP